MAARTQTELRLAEGTELLGRYQGSGLKDAPYLLRRHDGHNVQVSHLVYLVAEALAVADRPEAVAAVVSRRSGRDVSADNVLYLVEHKLAPVGVIAAHTGPGSEGSGSPPTADPLLALRLRVALVPERAHRMLTTALTPLFWPPVVLAAVAALVAVDLWLLTSLGTQVAEGTRMIFYEPQLLLLVTVLTLVAGAFHEMGHAAAARYGGATPGAMGAGVYLVWPVFYTDVSDTYRLSRRGRLRTDLGGVYFNVLLTLAAVVAYRGTGHQPMLVMAIMLQLETLRQFLPFVRLDGYYVMSDLAGVPNLFAYMGPVLTVLVRRRDSEALARARGKLHELTRRARLLIVGWVLVTAPVLAGNLVLFLFVLPRMAGTAWGSAAFQVDGMVTAEGAVSPVGVANGLTGLVLLALPVAGMSYLLAMLLARGARLAARSLPRRPALTGALTGTVALVLVAQVGTVWPGSFAAALRRVQDAPSAGRPPLQQALSDLPAGLSAFAHRTPVASPVELAGNGPEAAADQDPAQLAAATDPAPEREGAEPAAGSEPPSPPATGGPDGEQPSSPTATPPTSRSAEPERSDHVPRRQERGTSGTDRPGPATTTTVSGATSTTTSPAVEPPPRPPRPRPLERLAGALDELLE